MVRPCRCEKRRVEFAGRISTQLNARPIDANLIEGPRQAKKTAQLKVDENLVDGQEGCTVRVVQSQLIDSKAQDKRVQSNLADSQLRAVGFANRIAGNSRQQPGQHDGAQEGVKRDRR